MLLHVMTMADFKTIKKWNKGKITIKIKTELCEKRILMVFLVDKKL